MNRRVLVPRDRAHLKELVQSEVNVHGIACDLNHIDVSGIRVFDGLFGNTRFEGDVSQWNMANAISVEGMFRDCPFNGDISKWSMHNVERAKSMFFNSPFNGDISAWDVGRLEIANHMFYQSGFKGDVSHWNVAALTHAIGMFSDSAFNGDVSAWRPRRLAHAKNMFNTPFFHGDLSGWNLLPSGHYTGLVHPTFSGQLPPLPPTDPFAVYGAMLGSPHALDDYAARTDFCHVHADLLLANPTRCPWACPDTVRWAQEHASLGSAMGLEHGQLRATMVRNRADRGQGIGALPLLDAENFLP